MAQTARIQEIQPKEKRDLLGPDVGRRIRAVRHRQGLSLAQVGGDDLSRSFLSLVESGRSRISLRALAIVADKLQTPIGSFLQDEDVLRVAELTRDYAEIELENGNPEAAIAALESCGELDEPRTQWILGRAFMRMNDLPSAVTRLRSAVELASATGDSNLIGETLYSLGRALYLLDNYEEALTRLREGLDHALREPSNPALQARLHILVGHVHYVRDEIQPALASYDSATKLYGSLYELDKVGSVFSAMSLASKKQGDLDAALRYSKQSVATYRLKRDWKLLAQELNNMAMRYIDRGEFDAAAERALEAVRKATEVGEKEVQAYSRATLASVFLQQGRVEEAEEQAMLAESLAGDSFPFALVDVWLVRGNIAHMRGDHAAVDPLYRKALDALRPLGHRSRFKETSLEYSRILRERGDLQAALQAAMWAAGEPYQVQSAEAASEVA